MESSSSSSSGSLRRGRALGNGNQVPSCLVDGCSSDLSKCRDYHRRHKVCEIHSKTPKVFIRGLEQRFCQQCSRFHSLVEFDEGKRSCRKRLDGHNRRRRKPQPDSLAVNSGRLFSNHQGTRYLQFGGSQVLPTTAASSAWTGAVKVENDIMLYGNQSSLNFSGRKDMFPGILSQSSKRGKQLPFLQGIVSSTLPGDGTVVQPTGIDANATLAHRINSSQKMFSDGSSSNRAINSTCALSLLSSPQSETREIGFSQVMVQQQQPDMTPSTQPSLVPTGLNFSGIGMESGPLSNVLGSDGSGNAAANLHGQELFQIGPDDGSAATASRSHQTLSFSWE